MKIRRAVNEDVRLVFEWSNDPETRANSGSNESIPWEDHQVWFSHRLTDQETDFFILSSNDDEPFGVVRFENGIIGVNIAAMYRGQGLGAEAIALGCEKHFDARPDSTVVIAFIRPENVASQRAFMKANFVDSGEETKNGVLMKRYERRR